MFVVRSMFHDVEDFANSILMHESYAIAQIVHCDHCDICIVICCCTFCGELTGIVHVMSETECFEEWGVALACCCTRDGRQCRRFEVVIDSLNQVRAIRCPELSIQALNRY